MRPKSIGRLPPNSPFSCCPPSGRLRWTHSRLLVPRGVRASRAPIPTGRTTRSAAAAPAELNDSEPLHGPRPVCSGGFGPMILKAPFSLFFIRLTPISSLLAPRTWHGQDQPRHLFRLIQLDEVLSAWDEE